MDYEYIMRNYGRHFRRGQRVFHDEVKRPGTVAPDDPGCEHYVQVRFDGDRHASSCHPLSLRAESAAETMTEPANPKTETGA